MNFIRAILFVQFLITCILAQRVQEWGIPNPSGILLHEQRVRFVQTRPGGTAVLRRSIEYPQWVRKWNWNMYWWKSSWKSINDKWHSLQFKVDDESVPIGYIRVTHVADGVFSSAELRMGGPGQRFVGLELVSPPGRNIHAVIQIYF